MATKMHAVKRYCPTIELGKTVSQLELAEQIAGRTTLATGEVNLVLSELHQAILFFARAGRPVLISGLGKYTPKVSLSGKFGFNHRADRDLANTLNRKGYFEGNVINAQNKQKTMDDLVAMWNAEFPDDPIPVE